MDLKTKKEIIAVLRRQGRDDLVTVIARAHPKWKAANAQLEQAAKLVEAACKFDRMPRQKTKALKAIRTAQSIITAVERVADLSV